MKNIHILPTDKPSRLHEYDYLSPMGLSKEPLQWRLGINIYITSDEKIKNEDWCITAKGNLLQMIEEDTVLGFALLGCEKIILTTDQDLIKDGVQAIDDEFLKWFVKNPGCEEVKVNKSYGGTYYIEYPFVIPKEEPKQETLEDIAKWVIEFRITKNEYARVSDFEMYHTIIEKVSKWQQEKSYSEEEVLDILVKAIKDVKVKRLTFYDGGSEYPIYSNLSKWFEQFKKK